MDSGLEVSVVIPTRDRWPLLSATALPVALGQEDVDLEVVVVDDGSTDETPVQLRALQATEPRLRVLRHDRPRGVSAARNAGLAAARGEWVAFLDDDDVWSPRKLRAQLDVAGAENACYVYAGAVALGEHGQVLYTYYFPDPADLPAKLLQSAVIPGGASNVVARTALVRELGGFDERLLHLEDWDLWIRLVSAGRAAAVGEILVGVLFHSENKHALHDQSAELEYLIEKHASLTPARTLSVDRRGHARWVASQHSRAGRHRQAAWLYLRGAVEYRSPGNVLRAVDALLAKRPSAALAYLTKRTPPAATAAPPWLAWCPYFAALR
jgi:GT2 family glycosyltransferase